MKKFFPPALFFLCISFCVVSCATVDNKFGSIPGQICAGVNIHFTSGREKDLDMIAASGIKYIRMDFVWQETERSKGNYSWEDYDKLTAGLEKRGIKAIYILDYSNSLYEDTVESKDPLTGVSQKGIAAPRSPESVDAFAKWAAAAAEHFRKSKIVWEIWNEPNISFWKPESDINQYLTLAKATCKAIREIVPEAVIIGPATSQIPYDFIETFLKSGILEHIDAVSIHPYRNYSMSPETAGEDYDRLEKMIRDNSPANRKNIPLISSEWGYSSATNGLSPELQACYIVRMQLYNIYKGIPVSIWYDWKNDGDSPSDFEHNCGTVTSDLKPKPAYIAMQTMNMNLKGFTLQRRIDAKNDNDFLLLFRNDKKDYKICAWTMDQEHSVILDNISAGESAAAVDGSDNSLTLTTEKGKLIIDLKGLPQYIILPAGSEIR